MKRILAIFLLFWLPLFMQSAWAMSMRMQIAESNMALESSQLSDAESMPCHQHAKDSHQPHHCNHCVACAIVTASASYDAVPHLYVPQTEQTVVPSVNPRYLSIYLPPAIKPPILN